MGRPIVWKDGPLATPDVVVLNANSPESHHYSFPTHIYTNSNSPLPVDDHSYVLCLCCGPGRDSVPLASLSSRQGKGLTNPSATYCKLLQQRCHTLHSSLRTTNNKTRIGGAVNINPHKTLVCLALMMPDRDCQAWDWDNIVLCCIYP